MNVFENLKVVDCGSYVAGPAATTALADLGADVIKIEPAEGDPLRRLAPVYPSYFWRLDARSKRGLSIDLKHPTGREAFERLIRSADVFVTNYRTSLVERLELDSETLSALNPRLVYGHMSGYGTRGAEAERTAFDSTAWWGRSGMQDWIRNKGAETTVSSPGMGDHATAMSLFGAIMAALYQREITGVGTRVHTSLAANGAWSHSMAIQAVLADAKWAMNHPNRPDHAPPNLNQQYRTADARIILMSLLNREKEYLPLLRSLGLEALTADPRFADAAVGFGHMRELVSAVEVAIGERTLAELRAAFDRHGITYGFAQHTTEVIDDPQLRANDIVIDVEEPVPGYEATVASPLWIDGVEKRPPRLAPEIGEHNTEILTELGFTADEIDTMAQERVTTTYIPQKEE